jgi:hypothetical protein
VYGSWPLKEGEGFAIEFVHSVNQSPVREEYRAAGGRIAPTAAVFSSLGAGMPAVLEPGQTLERDESGNMRIRGFTVSYKELHYIVGTVSDHTLYIHNQAVSLRDLCGRNAHITLGFR